MNQAAARRFDKAIKQISGNPFKINSMKIRRVLWEPIIDNGDHSVRATVFQTLGTETKMPHHFILGATTIGKCSVPFSSSVPFVGGFRLS
jgi:hypothetical protein